MKTKNLLSSFVVAGMMMIAAQLQAQCQAGFTFNISSGTVAFTNTSTGGTPGTSYFWDFGDGNSSSGSAFATHTYFNGTYTACLYMSDSSNTSGGCWSTFCDTIVITTGTNPPCVKHWNYYQDSSNANSTTIQFYDQSAAVSWAWDFGDGNTSTLTSPVHQYALAGNYYVCLTTISSVGDTCTTCDSIHIYPPCNAIAGFTFNSTNDPAISFTNTSTGLIAPVYSWSFGDGSYASSVNATHTYQYNGTYNVCLSAYDSLNGCSANYCSVVTITNGSPQPCNAAFYTDSMNTPAMTIGFYDASTGGATSWFWDFGDGNTSTLQNPVHQYAVPGTYSVCLTITTASGTCSSCSSLTVGNYCGATLYLVPDSSNTSAYSWFAYPVVSGTAPFVYAWDFGDGTTSTQPYPTHTYAVAGHYNVCLTITDANGCTSATCDSTYKIASAGIIKNLVVVNPLAGIEENSVSVNSVFPNPANDRIEVSLNQPAKGVIRVMDLTGREVYQETINSNSVRVNVSNLPVGCYNLSIVTGDKTIHSKIMIAR